MADRRVLTLVERMLTSGAMARPPGVHVIRAPIADGRISEEGMLVVELTVKAAQMTAGAVPTHVMPMSLEYGGRE